MLVTKQSQLVQAYQEREEVIILGVPVPRGAVFEADFLTFLYVPELINVNFVGRCYFYGCDRLENPTFINNSFGCIYNHLINTNVLGDTNVVIKEDNGYINLHHRDDGNKIVKKYGKEGYMNATSQRIPLTSFVELDEGSNLEKAEHYRLWLRDEGLKNV